MTDTEVKMNAGRGAVLLFLAWCEGCVYKVEVDTGEACEGSGDGCGRDTSTEVDSGSTAADADGGGNELMENCYSSDLGMCFEFDGVEGISAWCDRLGASSYDYSPGSCPRPRVGACENVTIDALGGRTPTLYFYREFIGDPRSVCEGLGGEFSR